MQKIFLTKPDPYSDVYLINSDGTSEFLWKTQTVSDTHSVNYGSSECKTINGIDLIFRVEIWDAGVVLPDDYRGDLIFYGTSSGEQTEQNPESNNCFDEVTVTFQLDTLSPTLNPTIIPTLYPTLLPTLHPTLNPSLYPTLNPSLHPTINPSLHPTLLPSFNPTLFPSLNPTIAPYSITTTILLTNLLDNNVTFSNNDTHSNNENFDTLNQNKSSNHNVKTLIIILIILIILLLIIIVCFIIVCFYYFRHKKEKK